MSFGISNSCAVLLDVDVEILNIVKIHIFHPQGKVGDDGFPSAESTGVVCSAGAHSLRSSSCAVSTWEKACASQWTGWIYAPIWGKGYSLLFVLF